MEAALLRSIVTAFPDMDESNAHSVDELWVAARKFFDWERQAMILGEPTEQEKSDHRDVLRSLTRMVKAVGKSGLRSESLEMLKIRLNDSWEMFYSTMSEQEAEAILRKAFPE